MAMGPGVWCYTSYKTLKIVMFKEVTILSYLVSPITSTSALAAELFFVLTSDLLPPHVGSGVQIYFLFFEAPHLWRKESEHPIFILWFIVKSESTLALSTIKSLIGLL